MDATARRQLRHRIATETLHGKRSIIAWIGSGFVAAIAIIAMAYENTTVPKGLEARQAFERLFDAHGEKHVYDASGSAAQRRGFSRSGDVICRLHIDHGSSDRAYDYDCLATVSNRYDCVRFVPFYVEDSSIGKISRPVDAPTARQILADFKLLGPATTC